MFSQTNSTSTLPPPVGLPDVANKNTQNSSKWEFGIKTKIFSVSISLIEHGLHLY